MKYEYILREAFESDYGISIQFFSRSEAKSFRRKLYHCREQLRGRGCTKYDTLSFVAPSCERLLIVPRSIVPMGKNPAIKTIKLKLEEVPLSILSRGRSKIRTDSFQNPQWPP